MVLAKETLLLDIPTANDDYIAERLKHLSQIYHDQQLSLIQKRLKKLEIKVI